MSDKKEYCFIIQPFDDGGKFDKRYNDIFKPTLDEFGLDAYRVDKDNSVSIPIESIHEKIRESRFCLADITTDNPNVWYEVGYAIASEKDIILLCCIDERVKSYPFDIRHRAIINYKGESTSDFSKLSDSIKGRVNEILKKQTSIKMSVSINAEVNGFSQEEIVLLGSILNNQETPDDNVSIYLIKQDMTQSGLNNTAFGIASRKLLQKKMVEFTKGCDYNGNEYSEIHLTQSGNEWVLENENKFNLKKAVIYTASTSQIITNNDEGPYPF